MKPGTGRCAILFPHGVLFRDEEREMRERIIEADLVDCVLGLGPGLFYNSPMEACVLFCRTDKPVERKGKVLFINAVEEYAREQAQSFLRPHHIGRIVAAYRGAEHDGTFSYLADNSEVAGNRFSLSIPLYVQSSRAPAQSPGRGADAFAAAEEYVLRASEARLGMDGLVALLKEGTS
jgi:type I restriction enzyme M protein